MKKIILTLAIAISTLGAFAGEEVNPKALASFKNEFASAKEVTWTVTAEYFKAEFTFNGQYVNAFYNADGELMGLTRNITSLELPMNLQASLKKTYEEFWISDLFEITRSNSTGYYITLENADTKIVLKATVGEDWSVYKKAKKV